MSNRPPDEVIEEIKKRGLPGFVLIDSNPALAGEAWKQFLELMIKHPVRDGWTVELSKNWLVGSRAEVLLSTLSKSGCHRIMVGLESTNEENLTGIKKGQNFGKADILKETKEMIKQVHRYGIKLTLLLIVGFKKDTRETILSLADQIKESGADGANIFILTPYPKTALWDELVSDGLFNPDEYSADDFDCRHLVWHHDMGKQELEKAYRDLAQKVWSMGEILRRSSQAWRLSAGKQSPYGRLKSSGGFELGCAREHNSIRFHGSS